MSLISYLTRVHFADRVLEDALSEEMARNGIDRPLVISDRDTAQSDGFDRLLCALPPAVEPVTHVTGQAGPAQELAGIADLLDGHACDGIIGFGGMAALDMARLSGSAARPVIAVPTGTQTVGLGPLGRDAAALPGRHPVLPAAILCDATLTAAGSPAETAAAGMGVLCHCLESFLGTAFNPPADGIALDGLRRAALHLEAAVQDGTDIPARREMLAAALDAGLASEKGYGGIEAASHGLETVAQSRHGVLHGALLAQILGFNAPAVSDRFDLLRKTLDLPACADPGERLAILAERVGLPLRLSEIGIDAQVLPLAARRAAADPANRTNPRHATARDYERMMRAVL